MLHKTNPFIKDVINLFITFTSNPKWKDITESLLPGQMAYDRHDIIAPVFHLKVNALNALLVRGVQCFMYTVEGKNVACHMFIYDFVLKIVFMQIKRRNNMCRDSGSTKRSRAR